MFFPPLSLEYLCPGRLFLQCWDIGFIQHTTETLWMQIEITLSTATKKSRSAAEAFGMQVEVLPIFCDGITDPVPALMECPAKLLEQLTAFRLERTQVRTMCRCWVISVTLDAEIYHSVRHVCLTPFLAFL